MRYLVALIVILNSISLGLAQPKVDTVRFYFTMDGNPYPGVNFVIKGSDTGAVSDLRGLTTLIIPSDKDIVIASLIGPRVELKIIRPVDSIHVDIDRHRATYFLDKRKIRKRRAVLSSD